MSLIDNVKESYNEMVNKVSWPSYKELTQSAALVLVASIILALVVWGMDWIFEELMTLIYGLF
jgi:preprotein translocase subunit SecE